MKTNLVIGQLENLQAALSYEKIPLPKSTKMKRAIQDGIDKINELTFETEYKDMIIQDLIRNVDLPNEPEN